MFSLKFLLLTGIIFGSVISCNKDLGINSNSDAMKIRSRSNEATMHEPDYEKLGKTLYEYLKDYSAITSPEVFFLPVEYRNQFKVKIDSFANLYKNNTYEEILSDFVSKGLISNELKSYKIILYNDLFNGIPDVKRYLESKFVNIDQLNLSQDEKYNFKTEVTLLKYAYQYISEIDQRSIDSLRINLRDTGDDCDIDWEKYLNSLRNYVLWGSGVGAAIGSIIPGFGTGLGGGIGAIVGLGFGLMIEWDETDQDIRFCEKCIPAGLSHRLVDNCNPSAFFVAKAGSAAYKFNWSIVNGVPTSATTVPGQELLITQTNQNAPLSIVITSFCHYDEDTDLQLSKPFGPYNLFNEQVKVPESALFFIGQDYFIFNPGPTANQNFETYNVSATSNYILSGVAIDNPGKFTISDVLYSQNASYVSLEGNSLRVNWKVDSDHWDEFVGYDAGLGGQTEGIITLKVTNNCSGGESKLFNLKVTIENPNFQHP